MTEQVKRNDNRGWNITHKDTFQSFNNSNHSNVVENKQTNKTSIKKISGYKGVANSKAQKKRSKSV